MIDPIYFYIVGKIQEPGMGEVHVIKQGKGGADVGAMLEGTAAAVNDDLFATVLFGQECAEAVDVCLFMGWPRFDGPLDQPGRSYANDERPRCDGVAEPGSKVGGFHELAGCPGFGLAYGGGCEDCCEQQDKAGTEDFCLCHVRRV